MPETRHKKHVCRHDSLGQSCDGGTRKAATFTKLSLPCISRSDSPFLIPDDEENEDESSMSSSSPSPETLFDPTERRNSVSVSLQKDDIVLNNSSSFSNGRVASASSIKPDVDADLFPITTTSSSTTANIVSHFASASSSSSATDSVLATFFSPHNLTTDSKNSFTTHSSKEGNDKWDTREKGGLSSSKLSSKHLAARELAIVDRVSISSISPKHDSLGNKSSLMGEGSSPLTPPSRLSRIKQLSPPSSSSLHLASRENKELNHSSVRDGYSQPEQKIINPPSSKRRPKPPDNLANNSNKNWSEQGNKNRVVVHRGNSRPLQSGSRLRVTSPKKDSYSGGDENSEGGSPLRQFTARKALFRDDTSGERDSRASKRSLEFDENEPLTQRERHLLEERDSAVAELLAAQAMNDLLEDQVRSLYQLEVDAVAERNRIASELEELEIKYSRVLVLLQDSEGDKSRISTTIHNITSHNDINSTAVSVSPRRERRTISTKSSAHDNDRHLLIPHMPDLLSSSPPSSPEGPQPDDNLPILPFIRLQTPRITNTSLSDTPQPPNASSTSFRSFHKNHNVSRENSTTRSNNTTFLPSDSVALPSSMKLSTMMQSALLSTSSCFSSSSSSSCSSVAASPSAYPCFSPSRFGSSSASSPRSSTLPSSPTSSHSSPIYSSMFVPNSLQELSDWLDRLHRDNPTNKSRYAGDFHHSYLPSFIPTPEDLDQIQLWERLRVHEASRHESTRKKKKTKNRKKMFKSPSSLTINNTETKTPSPLSPSTFYPPFTSAAGPSNGLLFSSLTKAAPSPSHLFSSLPFANGSTLFAAAVSSCNTPSLAVASPRNNAVTSPRNNNSSNGTHLQLTVNSVTNNLLTSPPTPWISPLAISSHIQSQAPSLVPWSPSSIRKTLPIAAPSVVASSSSSASPFSPFSSRGVVCSPCAPSSSFSLSSPPPCFSPALFSSSAVAILDPLEEEDSEHEGDEPGCSTPRTSPSKICCRENSESPNKSLYYEEYEVQGF